MSELFDHLPELASLAGVMTHVIAGNVVQGSTEPFSIGLDERNTTESKRATRHVRAGLVVLDSRPAFESTNDAPAVVDHALESG